MHIPNAYLLRWSRKRIIAALKTISPVVYRFCTFSRNFTCARARVYTAQHHEKRKTNKLAAKSTRD